MPGRRCVVQGCSNESNTCAGISMHSSPSLKSERDKWVRFVRTRRANFDAPGKFAVCSVHFNQDCFEKAFHVDESRRRLLAGAVPSIWKIEPQKPSSARDRRMIINELLQENRPDSLSTVVPSTGDGHSSTSNEEQPLSQPIQVQEHPSSPSRSSTSNEEQPLGQPIQVQEYPSSPSRSSTSNEEQLSQPDQVQYSSSPSRLTANEEPVCQPIPVLGNSSSMGKMTPDEEPVCSAMDDHEESISLSEVISNEACANCDALKKEKKRVQRKLNAMESKMESLTKKMSANQMEWANMFDLLNNSPPAMISSETQTDIEDIKEKVPQMPLIEDICMDDENEDKEESEEVGEEDPPWTPQEVDAAYMKEGDDDDIEASAKPRLSCDGKNVREEPKGIVFLSKLLLLFEYCQLCFAKNPALSVFQTGTMLTIESSCSICQGTFKWESQPHMLGKFPAGNLLLSFAILCAGASVNKVLLIFRHMGLLIYHHPTYYYHQRHLLFPTIVKYWRTYQSKILESLKGKEVSLAGDGRHDSMGHSAKYGTYTIFCCTVGLIIHIVLLQANEAGSSSKMEFLGHQKALAFLLGTGLIIKSFISDRHSAITKWMRVECPKICEDLGKPVIDHFFDLWHIGKKIQKVLTKLSKEKGCEIIARWRKACVRHYYWAVTSSKPKDKNLILAKFKAFLSHIINVHKKIPNNPLFETCAHGAITTARVWLTKGSLAYEKLCDALSNKFLLTGISKSSPDAQTSALEGYHSVVNQFAPKMLAFSYLGMLCRTILAAIHFNFNLKRGNKVNEKGESKLKVTYPKFKDGEATVRERKVEQNYDYVAEIFDTMMTTPREVLNSLRDELNNQVPEALHSMLKDKEDKEEAKTKYRNRKQKRTVLCPATCSDAERESLTPSQPVATTRRRTYKCRKCGNPLKGHKKGQCSNS